jgi:DNA repair photolyase
VRAVPDASETPLDAIERKSLLYKSGLGFWCINHVLGCSHGCRYPCYAYLMARHHGRVRHYTQWCRPRTVGNALVLLDRELERKRVLPPEVHLCLTTDPFMVAHPEVGAMSLAIIERLNRSGIPCSLLTKGRLPAELADRQRFPCDNTLGISLVSLDEGFRREWEPGAAPYAERIAALRRLHVAGRRTRVHIEPYPTPSIFKQNLAEILAEVKFVDHMFFGGWNYSSRVSQDCATETFYRSQRRFVRQFCAQHGIDCEVA